MTFDRSLDGRIGLDGRVSFKNQNLAFSQTYVNHWPFSFHFAPSSTELSRLISRKVDELSRHANQCKRPSRAEPRKGQKSIIFCPTWIHYLGHPSKSESKSESLNEWNWLWINNDALTVSSVSVTRKQKLWQDEDGRDLICSWKWYSHIHDPMPISSWI